MRRLLIRRLLHSLGLAAVAAALFVAATVTVFADTPVLSAPEAATRLASGEMILLDIRSPEEWAETGVAEGAWPVSMHTDTFGRDLQAILARYAPEQIALICATGKRSAYVTGVLRENGIEGIADISEGMFGNGQDAGWVARGLSVVSIADAKAQLAEARAAWE